jgi:hypothetical protein
MQQRDAVSGVRLYTRAHLISSDARVRLRAFGGAFVLMAGLF